METKKRIVIFGSARTQSKEKDYKTAYQLSKQLAQRNVEIITGGGPGIMEAANKGALDAKGKSYGYSLDIEDQQPNNYCQEEFSIRCTDFQERKKLLMKEMDIFILFPGGFGTLDELFEVAVHMHTKKLKTSPIILYNKGFWTKLIDWINSELVERNLVDKNAVQIIKVCDSLEEMLNNIDNYFDNKTLSH